MMTLTKQNLRGPVLLLLATVIWGVQFPASKAALNVLEPMELVFLRLIIGAACLFIIGLCSHVSWHLRRRDWPLIIVMSLSGYVISIWAQFYGTQLTTAQMSVVIMSTIPVGMVLLAKLILKERIGLRKWLAVTIATIGTAIIIGIGNVSPDQQFGGLILVFSVFTVALMMVLVKKVPTDYSMIMITMYNMLISDIVLFPFEITKMPHALSLMAQDMTLTGCVLFIGIFATGIAYYIWNKGLTYTSASTGGMVLFVQPIVGTLLGWLWLGETIGLSFVIGTALILLSGALVAKAH